ncbi:mediator of RNA polymerase II transcription subunit 31 [Achlya hypogyna]|uniref:Mediator of RNA polymerase II transcription subunit 31 n=1 Tax=Achlya hypogyna TaxID=1202772 RepID=A0A1V9ZAQ8_ACHHY|nr:mediator of RNA polymerase II transcription subunit 31 [Achlya hypogyna]
MELPTDDIRFQIELEFIQCLASPSYLNHLAINRYFEDPAFLNYLAYLKYWKRPEYAKYINYPHALTFLDLLDDEKFRQMIAHDSFRDMVHAQQGLHWLHFMNNRTKPRPKPLVMDETPQAKVLADAPTPALSRKASDPTNLAATPRRRLLPRSSKRALFSPDTPAKRKCDLDEEPPMRKAIRRLSMLDDVTETAHTIMEPLRPIFVRSFSEPEALSYASYQPKLPTVPSSKHPDLHVITPTIAHQVLCGDFASVFHGVKVFDCRFEYEYSGGHVVDAMSLASPEAVNDLLFAPALEYSKTTALIFYCEFSAKRAPQMMRHIRKIDRFIHASKYPELHYPEMYLIDGGYKQCFETRLEMCRPPTYTAMDDPAHAEASKNQMHALRQRWKTHESRLCRPGR